MSLAIFFLFLTLVFNLLTTDNHMQNYKKTFGNHLKHLRKAAGMTQKDLAAASDLSLQYISEVERGVANPKLETLLRIAEGLNVVPLELFYIEGLGLPEGTQREKLASAIMQLDDATLQSITKLFLPLPHQSKNKMNGKKNKQGVNL